MSLKKKLYNRLYDFDLKSFAKKAVILRNHFLPHKNVIDVGCGSGRFSKFLADEFSCKVTGADTVNYLAMAIPFIKFEFDAHGVRVPLPDKSFDIAFCSAVIHHTQNPEQMICELHRIAKKVVLIEDYCQTRFGKLGLLLNDYFTNIVQNFYKCWCGYHPWSVFGMQWVLRFKTEAELRAIFLRNKISLLSFTRTIPSWKGMSHGIYVLA